jgi:Tfp pilus assembly protein PilE
VSEAAKARMLKTDQFMERQSAQTSGAATKNIISEKCNISGEIIK